MFFEGSEKKFELSVIPGFPSLRSKGQEFYSQVVARSCAQILSKISTEHCDAYLLSESSLFVWDDRITMITCGTTKLCDAALFVMESISPVNVESLFYERKNEYFPRQQSSHFYDDVKKLNKVFPGRAYRLGESNEHHLYLFHGTKNYTPPEQDSTLEILMYGLSEEANRVFNCAEKNCAQTIRSFLKVDNLFQDFLFDDYAFDPIGYSCNALKGSEFYTIHVSPQNEGAYVSFETNIATLSAQEITEQVTQIFKPKSFDVIQFNSNELQVVDMKGLRKKMGVKDNLAGYNVLYKTYYKYEDAYNKAQLIEIKD